MKFVNKNWNTLLKQQQDRCNTLLKQHLCKLARDAPNRMQRALEVFQQIVHVLYANAQSARTDLSI
jgi:hypothetical protein